MRFVLLSGPGKPENYLIHQIEPMVALLRARPVRVLYAGVEGAASYTVEFADGKLGVANLLVEGPFQTTVKFADGAVVPIAESTETFDRLIAGMVRFFETGEVQVDARETVAIAAILEAAHKAEAVPGEWVAVE